ncbi:MAG: hypothetical protein COU68_04185 [Candidatus Pacebacteria bacterium CG10_big_fil_rev_8_21_14_0_10_45_6]|nr:MAG: hypothetical protein COU68_04185 [Candidatus Pacebacteria bacterium CG10_big_fil_rev_8_21_14_0_10_45_6]
MENLDTRIQEVNKQATTHMAENLTRLTAILDKVATKASVLSPEAAAITTAKTALAKAHEAVASQAAKQYVISITTEESLGQAVRATLALVRADLRTTHAVVSEAKTAVIAAIRIVATAQPAPFEPETNEVE